MPINKGLLKLEQTAAKYERAKSIAKCATPARQLKSLHDLGEHWDAFKTEPGLIANLETESDADVKAALSDPRFQRFVDQGADGRKALRTAFDLDAETPAFKKIAPECALASFAVDYGYDVKKWLESKERILQGNTVTEEALKAALALKHQIERTRNSILEVFGPQ